MKLREVLPADAEVATPDADIEVGGVSADSRAIKRGDVFVAIEGGKTDGLNFIGVCDRRRCGRRGGATASGHTIAHGCKFRTSRQRAAHTRAHGGQVFSPPAADYRRRHRHQRQNLGRCVHASDLDGAGTSRRQHRHHRHRFASWRDLWLADHAGSRWRCTVRSTRWRPTASRTSPSKLPRTASTSTGSTVCASRPGLSPTSRAIILTIIRVSKLILPPSCGCLRRWWNRMAPRSSRSIMNTRRPLSRRPARAVFQSSVSDATELASVSLNRSLKGSRKLCRSNTEAKLFACVAAGR